MSTSIRQSEAADAAGLSKVCLLTAASGSSAEHLHTYPDLPGLIFALPYNELETTFGFVLVDEAGPQALGQESLSATQSESSIVGYIVGTSDTRKYEAAAEQKWWPGLRERFPKRDDPLRKPADTRYINIIHSSQTAPDELVSRFPAHIHINILPSHQRKSYGRVLMAAAVQYLSERGLNGLHVGLDPSNEPAKKFYSRLGFERIEAEDTGEWWGLDFANFRR